MPKQILLLAVSILGAVLTFAATAWGIISEKRARERQGPDARRDKGLGRQGQVALALALGSALVTTTALGIGALIDRQKQAASEAAKIEAAREEQRQIEEGKRWDKLRDDQARQQGEFLSGLERREATRHAQDILESQRLIAAVEAQREEAIASGARRLQLDQARRIQQVHPLQSLVVQLTFGGFSSAEFDELAANADHVATGGEREDDYGRMVDVRAELDRAGRFRSVLAPAIGWMARAPATGAASDGPEDRLLALDLGGEGAWFLPLGVTRQPRARGYLLNRAWLADQWDPYRRQAVEGQEIGPCALPEVELDERNRLLMVTWSIPSDCLPFAVHLPGNVSPTARLSEAPRMVVFLRDEAFPPDATNVASIDRNVYRRCWEPVSGTTGSRYVEVIAIPNANPRIAVRRRLVQRAQIGVTFQISNEEAPEDRGLCSLYS